jgi:Protein of unknown function (DUF4238)
MSEDVKSQHYVHRAYLEAFCDPQLAREGKSVLWMYMPDKSPFTQRPERVVKRNYYYCFQDKDRREFHAEHDLQKIEDLALQILRKARERDLNLSEDDRLLFAAYIGLSHTRVPRFQRTIDRLSCLISAKELESVANDPERLDRVIGEISTTTGEKIDRQDFLKALIGGTVEITQKNRGWSLKQMFTAVNKLQYVISNMHWTLLLCSREDPVFLTSDNPVSLLDPAAADQEAIGFASSPEAHFTFPLSRNVCLLGQHTKDPATYQMNGSQVRTTNTNTIERADSQIYAPFKSDAIQTILNRTVARRKAPGRVLFSKGRVVQE